MSFSDFKKPIIGPWYKFKERNDDIGYRGYSKARTILDLTDPNMLSNASGIFTFYYEDTILSGKWHITGANAQNFQTEKEAMEWVEAWIIENGIKPVSQEQFDYYLMLR